MKKRIISRASMLGASRGLHLNKQVDDYDLPERVKRSIKRSRYSIKELNERYTQAKRELEALQD